MLFPNSILYVAFTLCTSLVYWLLPWRLRVGWLIASGAVYYAYASPRTLPVLVCIMIVTYLCASLIQHHRNHARPILVTGLAFLVSVLAAFKYSGLLHASTLMRGDLTFMLVSLGLPLGISFFTFEFIHYLSDVYTKKIDRISPTHFLAFSLFYPSVIAGPLKRYEQFSAQLPQRVFEVRYLYYGLLLLLLGYAQKIIIADPLVPVTSALQHLQPEAASTWQTWIRLVCYSVRIFADFAGLSNIAIGTGLLFGIVLPRNFASPYISQSIAEFWRRWHMSLSSWVRDYLYIPLGGNQRGLVLASLNLLLVMTIMGAWHGSSLNFLVWGLYQGGLLAAHRIWHAYFGKHLPHSIWRSALNIALTFACVTVGWAFFLTDSLHESLQLLRILFPFTHVA